MLRYLLTPLPLALRSLSQYPLRAALTALGVLIGVAAVVVTVALGEGAELAVKKRLSQLGDTSLTIRPERVQQTAAGAALRQPRLTERDGLFIAKQADAVSQVAPVLSARYPVAFEGFEHTPNVTGTNRDYLAMHGWQWAKGQPWSNQAEKTAQRVCVIGATVQRELFEPNNPVGRVLRIGRHPFRVIGVLKAKGQGQFGQDKDDLILLPISTMRSKLMPSQFDQVDEIQISVATAEASELAKQQVTAILRQRHGLFEEAQNDFRIRSQDAFGKTQDRIVGILGLLLTSIAAISLLVGGIGIMNIMLVSVTERTREIGIAMAVGATRRDILAQFLVESVVLSLLGGLLGTLVSLATTAALEKTLHIPLQPSSSALVVAVGVSLVIGVVFGVIPARKAASLDPIEALGRL